MTVRHRVSLAAEERQALEALVSGGTARVCRVKRAQVLLAAHSGRTDEAIARSVHVGTATVYRTKRRFVEGGIEHALYDAPAGRCSCWPTRWCASPNTTRCRARRCVGVWKRTSSSPGRSGCGASQR